MQQVQCKVRKVMRTISLLTTVCKLGFQKSTTCTVAVIIKVTFRLSATIVALRYSIWFGLVLAS